MQTERSALMTENVADFAPIVYSELARGQLEGGIPLWGETVSAFET